jgi:hypothetical protein
MIMKYVRGDLEARLLSRFEAIYLHSPNKRLRVDQARLFQQAVRDATRTEKPSALAQWFASPASRLRFALYSAALVAVILAIVVLPRWQQPIQRVLENPSPFAVSLSPGLVRGGTGVQIALPAGTRQVQFELALPQSVADEHYRVILGTPERPKVWSGTAARKGKAAVTTVPADLLGAGDYTLELQVNGAGVADYYFRIPK